MRKNSQTLIAALRIAVNTWRRREGWSRESVAQQIADIYHQGSGPVVTGLKFDPPTHDIYQRAHVNADRIFRWLDDETKDTNLLPANVLPYLLAVLPDDLRVQVANAMLEPAGLGVRVMASSSEHDLAHALQHVAREGGEAVAAMASLLDGTTPDELEAARQELTESAAAVEAALGIVEAKLRAKFIGAGS